MSVGNQKQPLITRIKQQNKNACSILSSKTSLVLVKRARCIKCLNASTANCTTF